MVDPSKTDQNKKLKYEKCSKQGHEISQCWSGTKKASKDTSSNKTQVKNN